jgi:hypothetical protein
MTFRLKEIRTIGHKPDYQRQAAILVPATGLSAKKRTLVTVNSSREAVTLANSVVANIALLEEANPDGYHVQAGAGMGFTGTANKRGVYVVPLLGNRVIMSAGGAAFAAATHLNVNRGIKKDGTTGMSYIDLSDSATPAFRVIRLIREVAQNVASPYEWTYPTEGDTNVLVEAEIISTAAWVDVA